MVTTKRHVEATIVVAGIDTHKDTHHVAVLDLLGRVLGTQEFPTTPAGYEAVADWIAEHGVIDRVGIELTGSYGAGLTRYLTAAGITVLEVNTTDKATRARQGKNDTIDAISAAQKVLSGMATATPKDTTTIAESVRILMLVRDSAVKARTQALNQIKDLIITAPAALREQFVGLTLSASAKKAAQLRPDRARLADPAQAGKLALKRLGDRIGDLTEEIVEAEKQLDVLVQDAVPTLLARPGIGTLTAAQFLITAGANIGRIQTDAAFAHLCGAAPIPASSGKTDRHRLNRFGDRQANRALHMIIIGRMRYDDETKTYIGKKLTEGKSKKDAIRALKRFLARRIFHDLTTDLRTPHITT
ncbi:IS110 family transposase [Agreia sp. PsM10]|uniref:IS110 family transposase n=1 Tax=Agreia sp. PsM10 TaxID=3030533 RepID=UPI00263A742F|nr:IS110 family transposase [Agreia sp. PsM10]MDN4642334.1 IS110 family transposase [Agreia sp. PsM10]